MGQLGCTRDLAQYHTLPQNRSSNHKAQHPTRSRKGLCGHERFTSIRDATAEISVYLHRQPVLTCRAIRNMMVDTERSPPEWLCPERVSSLVLSSLRNRTLISSPHFLYDSSIASLTSPPWPLSAMYLYVFKDQIPHIPVLVGLGKGIREPCFSRSERPRSVHVGSVISACCKWAVGGTRLVLECICS